MKIENNIIESHFGDIYVGDVFLYKCHYYIRIMSSQLCGTHTYNAIDIEDGMLTTFNENDTVAEVQGAFHVR